MVHIICHQGIVNLKKKRYHSTLIRMAKIQNTTSKAIEVVEQKEFSYLAGRNAKRNSHLEIHFGNFLMILSVILPCDPGTVLLDICPKWVENLFPEKHIHMDVYSSFNP